MNVQQEWDFDAVFHVILEEICREEGKTILRIEESAVNFLEEMNWDEDFENLRRVLKQVVRSARDGVISAKDLPLDGRPQRRPRLSKNDRTHRLHVS